jgi:hypothetical protein
MKIFEYLREFEKEFRKYHECLEGDFLGLNGVKNTIKTH